MGTVFDALAETYDGWYDTPVGMTIFEAERDCLLSLCHGPLDSWLEVGVGTGRFAHALGISTGVDPSPNMVKIAAGRGIKTCLGSAEELPFAEDSFDGVLMAFTLCFVADAPQALRECHWVLRMGGCLLIGIVPAGSAWGREYQKKAACGHPIYTHAHFRGARETIVCALKSEFVLCGKAGALFWKHGQATGQQPEIKFHYDEKAGFLGLLFKKTGEDYIVSSL